MIAYETFLENLSAVRARIKAACEKAARPISDVALLPVTKTHPEQATLYAHKAGLFTVGENRVQEAAAKKQAVPELAGTLRWELVGHLQSNKAKLALETFSRIQSVDSVALAQRLNRLWLERGQTDAFAILLEVNTGEDPNKFGFQTQQTAAALEEILSTCPALRVEGLMTVAPLEGGRAVARTAFAALRELRESLQAKFKTPLPELSMGMTDDLEEAILEGSTLIRVGTALFGTR